MGKKTIPLSQLGAEIEKIWTNLEKQTNSTKIKTTRKAGMFMVKLAKKLAPSKDKDVYKGIKGKKDGTGYKITSTVTEPWGHNVWVDNRKGKLSYSKAYKQVQKTGISGGGFFTKSKIATKKKFKELVIKDISKWETVI